MKYNTDQEWKDAIDSASDEERQQLQQEYGKWQDFGGENQVKLPDDFKKPDKKPTFDNFGDMRKYIESLVPNVQADLGDNSREAYQSEKERLGKVANSQYASPEEKRKAELLLNDLEGDFKKQNLEWLNADLRNAGSNEEAAAITAQIDKLRNQNVDDTKNRMVADIMTGGTGFGDASGWDGQMNLPSGEGMIDPALTDMINQWNDKPLADSYDQAGQDVIDNSRITGQQQHGYYDQATSRAIGDLTQANQDASTKTADAIAKLQESGQLTKDQINGILDGLVKSKDLTNTQAQKALKQLQGDYAGFKDERTAGQKSYEAALNPLQKQLEAQDGKTAVTSAEDINRLINSFTGIQDDATAARSRLGDVYNEYKDMSGDGITAQERAILEFANRNNARALKSSNDTLQRQLAARGGLSGGAMVAGNAANAAQLGDERIMATLQALAGGQQRKLSALGGMKDTATAGAKIGETAFNAAGDIRSGNDLMSRFNTEQENITSQFQDKYKQAEMERLQKLAQDKQNTVLNKTSGDLEASATINNSTQDAIDRLFNRDATVSDKELTAQRDAFSIDEGITDKTITGANNDANRQSNLTDAELTNARDKTNLIGATAQDEEDAIKYKLGLLAEKQALKNQGVTI